jgi:hypothetical protein
MPTWAGSKTHEKFVSQLRAISSFIRPCVSYLRNAEHRELYRSALHPGDRPDDMTATRRLAAILSTRVTVIRARAYCGLDDRLGGTENRPRRDD